MKISLEYLFQTCNLHHHAIGLELYDPIILDNTYVSILTVLSVVGNETYNQTLFNNILNGINSNNGKVKLKVSNKDGDPINYNIIEIRLDNIKGIEIIN